MCLHVAANVHFAHPVPWLPLDTRFLFSSTCWHTTVSLCDFLSAEFLWTMHTPERHSTRAIVFLLSCLPRYDELERKIKHEAEIAASTH